jgi:hypothetical protein
MGNLADAAHASHVAHIRAQARPVEYVAEGVSYTVPAYMRGVRPEELVGSSLQGDVWAFIAADDFALVTTRERPQRFDRIRTLGQSFTVEGHRAAPSFEGPVLFKINLRGGSQ